MQRKSAVVLLAIAACNFDLAPLAPECDPAIETCPPGASSTGTGTTSTSAGPGGSSSSTEGSGSESAGMTSGASPSSSSTSEAETDTTSTGTTSEPPPECGDGIVQPPEECDDGTDDWNDDCNFCTRDRVVFATSKLFTGDNLGGLKGADGICRQLAGKAGLARWQTFTAWLSDSQTNVLTRIYPTEGRWIRTDGVVVAKQGVQLLSGQLDAPIYVDEYGMPAFGGAAWTGTRPDGTAVPGAEHCQDWTAAGQLGWGHYGLATATDERWTLDPDPETNPTACSQLFLLLCFEGK